MRAKDPAGRKFGENNPYHIRVFHEQQGRYWLNSLGKASEKLSIEDYMRTEADEGYVIQWVTGAVEHPERLRLVTRHDAKEAANYKGRSEPPMKVRIFQEEGHEYVSVCPEDGGTTLDEFLANHHSKGYSLKSAAGMLDRDGSGDQSENRKLRVVVTLREVSAKKAQTTETKHSYRHR